MNGKTSFVMHSRHIKVFENLPGDDVKQIMLAIGAYVEKGVEPTFDGNAGLQMAFRFIRVDLDKEAEKWEETRAKRIEAGQKGGKVSAENRANAKQKEQK